MARVSVANHVKLSWLLLRGGLRQAAGRLNGHPLLRWPLPPLKADRLLIAPQDLRTADATRATEIYSGRFAFAGKVVICDGRSIFEMEPPSDEWAAALLGFGWLRHLRAAESGITRANARALVDEWIALQGSWHPVAWRPDVLSRRIISWLSQATLVLQDADARFYRRFLRSLVRQVRYLRHTAGDARRGVARMQAVIALTYAALCIAGQARHIKSATERLRHEIEPANSCPTAAMPAAIPARSSKCCWNCCRCGQAFASRNIAPPQALLNAIDRMMPMLRFFRHSEGTFAHFNGMGATPADLLLTLLAYDEIHGAPLSNAPYSAYQRLEAGGGVLIMDTGRAPPIEMSLEAHAGFLSFEFSTPKGSPDRRELRHAADRARGLAAVCPRHAGAFDGDVQRNFLGALCRDPRVPARARRLADARRPEPCRGDPRGSRRRHRLARGPRRLCRPLRHPARAHHPAGRGRHAVRGRGHVPRRRRQRPIARQRRRYAVRFHLHPSVKATRLTDGHGVMLMTANKEVWTFTAPDDRVELEDSVYLAGTEARAAPSQLVIHGHAGATPRVLWTFQQTTSAALATAGTGRRLREEEPRLPL